MNKTQRKEVVSGVHVTKQQDIALAASLDNSRPISKRPILAIVASALAACCAGAISSVIDVGQNAATTVVDGRSTGQAANLYLVTWDKTHARAVSIRSISRRYRLSQMQVLPCCTSTANSTLTYGKYSHWTCLSHIAVAT